MKIIDFEKKGNLVRFYLGYQSCNDYWGDDWDDAPYDCNAGTVYDRYVAGIREIVFPFDSLVLEPSECYIRSYDSGWDWTKKEMIHRKVPCIIVVPPELRTYQYNEDFNYWVDSDSDKVLKFYFEDQMYPAKTIKTWDFT